MYAHKHPKHMCIHTRMNIQMYSHTKQVKLRPSEGRDEGRRVAAIEEGVGEKEEEEKDFSKS